MHDGMVVRDVHNIEMEMFWKIDVLKAPVLQGGAGSRCLLPLQLATRFQQVTRTSRLVFPARVSEMRGHFRLMNRTYCHELTFICIVQVCPGVNLCRG